MQSSAVRNVYADSPEVDLLGKPRIEWIVDRIFVENALSQAEHSDIVCLDIFDTALTRLVDSPADAFCEMERRLVEALGALAAGFANEREDAERAARMKAHQERGAEEVTLRQIYGQLARGLPHMAPHVELAMDIELAVERDLLAPVPDILELVFALNKAGKPYLFVSDMYLPAESLADILTDCGYRGWSALLISCETMATKSSGRQWEAVKRAQPDATRILHIGDDEWSDGQNPKNFGIETLVYERARSERRLAGPLRPAILPFSKAQRSRVLEARANPAVDPTPADYWRDTGRVLGGLVLGAFVRWLSERVKRHGIDKLYFCARDGWLMQRAWQAAGFDRSSGAEDHYLCVSRRSLNFGHGYAESSQHRLSPSLTEFLGNSYGSTSVGDALQRAGLVDEQALVDETASLFGSLDRKLSNTDDIRVFGEILQRHASAVYRHLEPAYEGLTGYLLQEKVGRDGRCAIIDMGWNGTMQRSLRMMLQRLHGSASLSGFYYGLWPQALSNRFGAGYMEAAFGSEFRPMAEQYELHCAVDILEELHTAPHGTVLSYRQDMTGWKPVFANSPQEAAQYEAITVHFQDGALEAVRDLFTKGRSGSLFVDDLTPASARAAMAAFFASPSALDVRMIGQLGHCSTFDHSELTPVIAAVRPDNRDAQLKALGGGWTMGTARHWHADVATTDHDGLRDLIQQTIGHYGSRCLRQFT